MKKISAVLIGAGSRGKAYTDIMANMADKYQVVAVAEAIESRRNYIKEKHNLPDDRCFSDWKPLFELGKIADVAIIATMDREHYEPAMKAIDLKYNLLLEKPIAVTAEECERIARNAERNNVKVVVCTVLRYTRLFTRLKGLIDSGRIGKVVTIDHEECVGNVHYSHSYVRGNWGNTQRSSMMLLAKSCHDIDILQWLIGKKCKKVQSFGALNYFKRENAPEGAPDYCIEGCPIQSECPYDAVKLYLDDKENAWFRTACAREADPTDAMVEKAITDTQYGKCVYKCDNDVVDHQTVNMLFEDDVTATFTMSAFNKGGRFIHIMGTGGEVRAALDGEKPIDLYDYKTKQWEVIPIVGGNEITSGHGGGDEGIINALYDYLNNCYDGCSVPEIDVSSMNHLITFAAEKSRETNSVIDFDEYVKSLG